MPQTSGASAYLGGVPLSQDTPIGVLPIDGIEVRERSRRDLRNIEALAESIRTVGVLNPPTVRRVGVEWVLVAGERRLAAMRQLDWTETPVTVAESIEDELTALYAERDENTQREDFSPSEMVVHARRIEGRERELAKQRQREHGGTAPGRPNTGAESAQVPEPAHERKTRARTAKAVGTSHDTLDQSAAGEIRETRTARQSWRDIPRSPHHSDPIRTGQDGRGSSADAVD